MDCHSLVAWVLIMVRDAVLVICRGPRRGELVSKKTMFELHIPDWGTKPNHSESRPCIITKFWLSIPRYNTIPWLVMIS